jgi:hypothetical protein
MPLHIASKLLILNRHEIIPFTASPLFSRRKQQSLNQRVQGSSPCAPTIDLPRFCAGGTGRYSHRVLAKRWTVAQCVRGRELHRRAGGGGKARSGRLSPSLLEKTPRAKAVLELAAQKAGWGQPLAKGVGRGVSVQHAFANYMAHIAEVEVAKDGAVRVRRVVCAVDCGTVVNPDIVRAQVQGGIIFGITAALYGEITLKDGRVQ